MKQKILIDGIKISRLLLLIYLLSSGIGTRTWYGMLVLVFLLLFFAEGMIYDVYKSIRFIQQKTIKSRDEK